VSRNAYYRIKEMRLNLKNIVQNGTGKTTISSTDTEACRHTDSDNIDSECEGK
jgi:hypothetical protein